jgi:hypothetical protein
MTSKIDSPLRYFKTLLENPLKMRKIIEIEKAASLIAYASGVGSEYKNKKLGFLSRFRYHRRSKIL